jgi:hypothetical protein
MKCFFNKQHYHVLFLLVVLPVLWMYSRHLTGVLPIVNLPILWGFWASIIFVILHQMKVWFVFRSELCFGFVSKLFKDKALFLWAIIFLIFLFLRPILLIIVALASKNTLPGPIYVYQVIALISAFPAIYTLYSVFRYFGIYRAIGGDHFDAKYRKMPLVKEGAFKYSNNAMYTFAFLILWSMALLNQSVPALVLAAFQHSYIWIHYFTVEKPDMDKLYPKNIN